MREIYEIRALFSDINNNFHQVKYQKCKVHTRKIRNLEEIPLIIQFYSCYNVSDAGDAVEP